MAESAVADSTVGDLTVEDSIIIQRINHEREKILQNLDQSQQGYAIEMPVHKKYYLADRARLEGLDTPEDVVDAVLDNKTRKSLLDSLRLELENLNAEVTSANEMAQVKKESIQRLERQAANLKEMETFSKDELIHSRNIDLVGSRIKKQLIEAKQSLKSVLRKIFADDVDTINLIAELLNHNPESYLDLPEDEGVRERVASLLQTHLFELHPTNHFKIRMVDMS